MHKVRVSAASSLAYDYLDMRRAVQGALECLPFPLSFSVKAGDRVLIKPHLRHGSVRDPATRLVSHPVFIQCVVEAFLDHGARVVIGDEGSSTVGAYAARNQEHRLHELVKKTGAELVNFAVEGARAVRSGLHYPRHFSVTNAALDADLVVNCGNAQPHPRLVFSGAVKNMFNVLVGGTQNRMYTLFPDPRELGRVVASVCKAVRPGVSLLDMTTVCVPDGMAPHRRVGLVLASEDPVALDALAAQIIGYGDQRIWSTHYGVELGLGCASLSGISVVGADLAEDPCRHIPLPEISEGRREGLYARFSRFANTTFLRPRPTIAPARCTGCGDCRVMCPVGAVKPCDAGRYAIDLKTCIDCGCCAAACGCDAVELQHGIVGQSIRRVLGKEGARAR